LFCIYSLTFTVSKGIVADSATHAEKEAIRLLLISEEKGELT
jgi:hypothetical protein